MKRQGFPVAGLAGLVPSSGLAAPTIVGVPFIVYRTADTAARNNTNTGSTLTNDDATGGTLQFPITASGTAAYFVEAFLTFNAANITMDIKVGWNATGLPAGATAAWGPMAGAVTPTFAPVTTATTATAMNAIGATVSSGGPNNTNTSLAYGGWFFGGGTAGNIVFAWAQATADAGNLVLKASSFLRVTLLRA